MTKLLIALLSVSFISSVGLAADPSDVNAENKVEQSTSTNPLTGTKTVTKKHKKKYKGADGKSDDTATEKTKIYKDGSTSTSSEQKSSAAPAKP